MNTLALIGRKEALFEADLRRYGDLLLERVAASSFLVIGGAGSIGQAVCREIFRRKPKKLHVVDISENNLVELVRDLRSSQGYIDGEFRTFALDVNSIEYDALIRLDGAYDYILNLSALKHVRSEKDPFTLMRLIGVNIFNTEKTLQQAVRCGARKYFCVSTDKAANPVNMMGASKRIMEMYLMRRSLEVEVSTARFANVAFSDGSLLHGFNQRLKKRQPIVAPCDVRRYFVTPQESGELCLMSALLGENRDIFFPKLSDTLHLISFAEIAECYVRSKGYTPYLCEDEEEARAKVRVLSERGEWPCLFVRSDTTGEKPFEEFFTAKELLDLERFASIGVIKNDAEFDASKLEMFSRVIAELRAAGSWRKEELVALFRAMIPDFLHQETGRDLDGKM